MRKETFSVLVCARRKNHTDDKNYSLYARITTNGKRLEFTLDKTINSMYWDFKRGCVIIKNKESKELNSFVESAKLRIRNIKAELLERGK
ncbi:MAG: Arm DNA-binding domain-containing protein [Bacteroidales bacterium]|nr:Arm DNA-binding domain-containing protein [Bacteroidales bacterium]